jgi:hypothetical protein
VVNECVRSNSLKKEVPMDKETSSLKLKVVGTLKVPLFVFAFVLSMFSLESSYVHTRDSSRADSTFSSRIRLSFFLSAT